MTCAEARAALGVDALGALPPAEQQAVREHLADCPDCRAEQADLAGVPSLLALVTREEVEHAFSADVAESGIQRLQSKVRAERAERARHRRGRWALAVAAAALVAAAVGGTGWAVGRWVTPNLPVAQTTPTPTPTPTLHVTGPPVQWTKADPNSRVNASVTMNPVPWGTKVNIVLRGVKKGDVCSLVVYDRSGRKWDGGSWMVAYDKGVRWSGGVAVPADQVVRIEIFAPGERPIVQLEG